MSTEQINDQQHIEVPPLAVNLPGKAVEVLLKGLSKLTIEEGGAAFTQLQGAWQQHVQQTVAAAQQLAAPVDPTPISRAARRAKRK